MILFWPRTNATPASKPQTLFKAVRKYWQDSNVLSQACPRFYFGRAKENVQLPYAVVSPIVRRIDPTTGNAEVHSAQFQIALFDTTAEKCEELAYVFSQKTTGFHFCQLPLGGKEMSCIVGNVIDPILDTERGVGGTLVWASILDITALFNKL